ncbi:restriction endonuclease subunit S [Tenacibaculum finnmarkense]|uniref:restriction endonuclease subunit S n=1 Tax=Tenacibaculum finnmarkense TaxID=2781243 RepID=UPI001EFC2B66|nr:restriction endonuclease subunit S [Tenacibaculum finnmarkense]MCG8807443.1 restriction endonuclease subunit S [Tenacibaculum finnmarkense]MCG8817662.1 restriction endonuclease subunit S [Tenacibaculum finnmarkense]
MSKIPYIQLKDLCTVNQGLQIPISKRFKSNGENRYFYITVQFLKESHNEKHYVENPPKSSICKEDDIIVVRTGSTGKILTGIKGCFHNNFFKVNYDKEKVVGKYLYYCLKSKEKQKEMKNRSGITTIPDLNHFMFLDMKIPLPSYSNQLKIVEVLDNINSKIAINNKINAALEAMAKTLYDYWFVQFDFPDKNGKPYKSSEGKMIFNEDLKREIPVGWEVDNLSNWIKNDKSGDWGKETEQGNYVNKVSCIRGADLNGINGKGSVKSPTRFVLEKNSHKLLEIGDFIIEISGGSPTQSTGRMAFITKETLERFENPLICSNFCKAVTLKDEKALYNFAYEWNRIYDAGILFGWEGKTSGIKNLLFESFVTNHKLSKPNSDIMEQFYTKAKPIHAQIQKNLKQNQKLSELRDWLLPMLMNGQVSVGEK